MKLPFNFTRKSTPLIVFLFSLFLLCITAGARAQSILEKPFSSFASFAPKKAPATKIIKAQQSAICEGEAAHVSAGAAFPLEGGLQWKVARNAGGPYTNVKGGSGKNGSFYTSEELPAGIYYYVLAYGDRELSNEISVRVRELPHVSGHASATTVCNGTPICLCGHGALSYNWSGDVHDKEPFVPTSSVSYILQGTDANGCSSSDTVNIIVKPLPDVVAHVSNNMVSSGTSVTLHGSGALSYSWSNGVTDGQAFVPSATETYVVKGKDANGCENLDVITVVVNPAQEIPIGKN
jgi:hypothetical protein